MIISEFLYLLKNLMIIFNSFKCHSLWYILLYHSLFIHKYKLVRNFLIHKTTGDCFITGIMESPTLLKVALHHLRSDCNIVSGYRQGISASQLGYVIEPNTITQQTREVIQKRNQKISVVFSRLHSFATMLFTDQGNMYSCLISTYLNCLFLYSDLILHN